MPVICCIKVPTYLLTYLIGSTVVNVGRQLGSSPSNNFAARLVRLMSPLNILVIYSILFNRLIPFTYFWKFTLFVPDNLHAPL